MEEDQERDARATQILGRTQDYDQAEQWIQQLQKSQHLKLENVLAGVKNNPLLRDYDKFANELFTNKSEMVIEMIQWIFTPKRIIARKQLQPYPKVKYFQPYLCKQLIRDNIYFYENMYKAARNQSIPINLWFHFLTVEPIDQIIMPTILSYFKEIFIPFISQDYHSYANLNLSYDLQKSHSDLGNTILKLFTQPLIKILLEFCYYEEIFQFLYKLVLISLEEEIQSQRAVAILRKLYERVKQDDFILRNMNNLMKQLFQNIMNDRLRRGNVLIQMLAQTGICEHCVKRIINSDLCQIPDSTKQEQIEQEQQKIEFHLNFLIQFIVIYRKITEQSPIRSSKTEEQLIQDPSVVIPKDKEMQKIELQKSIVYLMQKQITIILNNLHIMCKLIQHQQFRRIILANQQAIKPVTLVKYHFFRLLLECLQIAQVKSKNSQWNINKIAIFPLIIRYLTQNRWNNQVHHLLEKIAHEIIINNYSFFCEQNIEQNKIADCFLGNLSREFTNKYYYFLNTSNTTTQGNLHSIYEISKKISYELNRNDSLMKVWKDFEPWKKLIKDLKNYEDGLKYGLIPFDQQQSSRRQKSAEVKVDEVASISKLLAFIDYTESRWPIKQTRKVKLGAQLTRTPNRGSYYFTHYDNMTQSQNNESKNRRYYVGSGQDINFSFPLFKKSNSEQQLLRIKRKIDTEQQQSLLKNNESSQEINKTSILQHINEQQQRTSINQSKKQQGKFQKEKPNPKDPITQQ